MLIKRQINGSVNKFLSLKAKSQMLTSSKRSSSKSSEDSTVTTGSSLHQKERRNVLELQKYTQVKMVDLKIAKD